ncbi:transposase [Roseicella sp. DB1501]|uniref:transposase n=1 Tax=Roseicella sp. DB1501 TaxID=2730925 RepID=UPI0038CF4D30
MSSSRRLQFGHSSERLSREADQLQLALEELEADAPAPAGPDIPPAGEDSSISVTPGRRSSRCTSVQSGSALRRCRTMAPAPYHCCDTSSSMIRSSPPTSSACYAHSVALPTAPLTESPAESPDVILADRAPEGDL